MIFWQSMLVLATASLVFGSPLEKRASRKSAFTWGKTKIRGLNVGGWLVLEPWITPSIFRNVPQNLGIVDEYTLSQKLERKQSLSILKNHWDTWVSKSDFQKAASAGFNVLRIPIGYWAYDNTYSPYHPGAAPYIDKAIAWARSTNPPLKIMIDLHGAPGSQNGFDNSGQRILKPKRFTWLDGGVWGSTSQKTLRVLNKIWYKYGCAEYEDVVIGIELINEPFGPSLNVGDLYNFYRAGYNNARKASKETTVVLSDGFRQTSSWNGFLTPQDHNAQHVAMDHHEYQIFSDGEVSMLPWQHRQAVCNRANTYSYADKWTFVGEWTAAMTDCAPELNGYRIGARFDGTYPGSKRVGSCSKYNSISDWPQYYRNDVRGYIEAQLEAFEQRTQGWVFWTMKTEGAQEWDAFALLNAGIMPQPLTARKFSAICDNL